jgi:sec-independent protein translocase protein TatA
MLSNAICFLRPSLGEVLLIILVVLIVFGAKRLPELGKTVGTAIRNFQNSLKGKDADE